MNDVTHPLPTPQTHALVRLSPRRDRTAEYRILVPRGWGTATRIGGVRFELGRAEPIGFFVESDRAGAAAIVASMARVPVEMRLEDYVRGQCAHEGWRVECLQRFPVETGAVRLEALAERGHGADCSRRRVVAFVDNGRVMLSSATARLSSWKRLEPCLWGSLASFELLAPTGVERLEAWEKHAAGCVQFQLPESWTSRPVAAAPELSAVDARLTYGHSEAERQSEGERLHGYVRVKAKRSTQPRSVEQLLSVADHELRDARVVPAVHKLALVHPAGVEMPKGWLGTFVSEVRTSRGMGEAFYGFKFTDGVEVSVVSLSPSLVEGRTACLRTRRTFEIALATAGPP